MDRQAYRAHGTQAMAPAENNPESGRSSSASLPRGDPSGRGCRRARGCPRVHVLQAALGPGGQNVNRRSTKARLRVRLEDLPLRPAARLPGDSSPSPRSLTHRRPRTRSSPATASRSQRANKHEPASTGSESWSPRPWSPPSHASPPGPSQRSSVERRLRDKRQQDQI